MYDQIHEDEFADDQRIVRVIKNKTNPFFMTLRETARNKKLSLKARGLLWLMLSFPDNWQFHFEHLTQYSEKDGRDSFRSAMKELQEAKYLLLVEVREKGRFMRYEWYVFEEPTAFARTGAPQTENPSAENPLAENPPLNNNDSTRTDFKKKEEAASPHFSEFERATPSKQNKAAAPKQKKPPTSKKDSSFKDDDVVTYPKELSVLAKHFERLIGRSPTSKSELAFWMYGNPKTGAKGIFHFVKMRVTPETMTFAYNKMADMPGVIISSPNTIFNLSVQNQKKAEKGAAPSNSINDIRLQQKEARDRMKKIRANQGEEPAYENV